VNGRVALEIELVPKTAHRMNLRTCIPVSQWLRLRKKVFEQAENRCELCSREGKRLQCHEVWEYDEASSTQTLKRLIALCFPCHEAKHFGFWSSRGQSDAMRDYLGDVNGWTETQVDEHIEQAYEVCKRRSGIEWKLDVSFYSNLYGLTINLKKVEVISC
jgi:hypothetical protein